MGVFDPDLGGCLLPYRASHGYSYPRSGGSMDKSLASRPNVGLLATGGTIAGAGESVAYRAGVVSIADILSSVPGLAEIANVSAEQVANVGSYDVDEALWRTLVARIDSARV